MSTKSHPVEFKFGNAIHCLTIEEARKAIEYLQGAIRLADAGASFGVVNYDGLCAEDARSRLLKSLYEISGKIYHGSCAAAVADIDVLIAARIRMALTEKT